MHRKAQEFQGKRVEFRREEGIALVIVLFCIALLAMMVVAFLSSARTEQAASGQYAVSAQAQQLAASALNVAMGQLSEAADLKWAADPTTVAWASQPGMIRTYDNTGTPLNFYKLYSSDQMIFDGSTIGSASGLSTVLANDRPGNWDKQPALFTDLNEPAVRLVNGATTPYFPIVDPRAAAVLIPNIRINNVTQPVVPGFTYTTTAGGSPLDGAKKPTNVSDTTARLPMPVKWLYVLKDGTLQAPTTTNSGLTATVAGAGPNNPIVGRVAFWMDDDTCKVNINTASEGSFWDVPVSQNQWEYNNLDINWPVQGEFQRFPGHPATTSLSAVFPTLKSPYSNSTSYQSNSYPASANPYAIPLVPPDSSDPSFPLNLKNNDFYGMTPRIRQAGSNEGSINTQNITAGIPVSGDPLYDSVDELLYNDRTLGSRALRLAVAPPNLPLFTAQDLALRRFFLTAHSRAPETNLFNQPRVAIWPFDNNATQNRSAVELLMAQASTAGKKVAGIYSNEYFFTRNTPTGTPSALDPTNGALSPTYDFEDTPRSGRNKDIYAYLQTLTSQNIPGFGGSFLTKYPANPSLSPAISDRDQILTEIFDFIRSGLNSRTDLNPAAKGYTPNGDGYYGYRGVVYPTVPASSDPGAGTRGFGRFVTLGEASLVIGSIYCGLETDKDPITGLPYNMNGSGSPPSPAHAMDPSNRYSLTGRKAPNGDWVAENDMWPAMILEMFLPSPGVKNCDINVALRVDGLRTFTWSGYHNSNLATVNSPTPMWTSSLPNANLDGAGSKTFYLATDTEHTAGLGGLMMTRIGSSLLYKSTLNRTSLTGTVFPWTNPQGSIVTNYGTLPAAFVTPVPPSAAGITPEELQNWISYQTSLQMSLQGFTYTGGGTIDVTITPMEASGTGPGNPAWAQHFTITFPTFTMTQNPLPQVTMNAGNPVTNESWYDMDTRSHKHAGDNTMMDFMLAVYNPNAWPPTPDRDIVRSMVLRSSDNRLLAVRGTSVSDGTAAVTNDFVPHYFYTQQERSAHTLSATPYSYMGGVGRADPGYTVSNPPSHWLPVGNLVSDGMKSDGTVINKLATFDPNDRDSNYSVQNGSNVAPRVRYNTSAVMEGVASSPFAGRPGDFDTGPGGCPDGPYINKPDEGFDSNVGGGNWSYLNSNSSTLIKTLPVFFSPSRQIASPVRFGSLPTGLAYNRPWQTLLFCPNPAAGWTTKTEHPGFGIPVGGPPYTTPPDYLLLDLFWMPVTEPWAISDAFSTAGKVNMNYRMFPFDYITRTTALRAVFANTFITAISDYTFSSYWDNPSGGNNVYGAYKAQEAGTGTLRESKAFTRYPINPEATLLQFDEKFNGTGPDGRGPDIFRAPAQICSEFLVPGAPPGSDGAPNGSISSGTVTGGPFPTWSTATAALTATRASYTSGTGGLYNPNCFWQDKRLTGDNMRERPYDMLYPRLTTRSNVYTVHVRAQAILQTATTLTTAPTTFTDGKDRILGEYRVSYTIERYLDPNLTTYTAGTALGPYKMRVINQRTVDW